MIDVQAMAALSHMGGENLPWWANAIAAVGGVAVAVFVWLKGR